MYLEQMELNIDVIQITKMTLLFQRDMGVEDLELKNLPYNTYTKKTKQVTTYGLKAIPCLIL